MLLASTDVNAATDKRRALVIANTQYRNTSELKNPANDAALIASKLKSVGFEVQVEKNLSAKRFAEVLKDFSSGLEKESEALFYYAGHGLQFQGENFLVGTDATLKSEADLQFETFRLNAIIDVLEQRAGLALIFWDACRDNPVAENLLRNVTNTGTERVRSGAAPVPPRRGDTYIVFSAEPGRKAVDGDGQFSPFAESLARNLAVPGLELDDMLMKVTTEVREQTKDAQSPQRMSQLTRKFYFQKGASSEEQSDAEIIRNVAACSRTPVVREKAHNIYACRDVGSEKSDKQHRADSGCAKKYQTCTGNGFLVGPTGKPGPRNYINRRRTRDCNYHSQAPHFAEWKVTGPWRR
jgi:uncharacterized caspase-like protein